MKRWMSLVLGAGLLLSGIPAPAAAEAEARGGAGWAVAVVNLESVFAKHPATAPATEGLTQARKEAREAFVKESNVLKETLQRHQELIRAGKREEAAKELEKANEAEKAIATLRTRDQRDLEEKFRAAKAAILQDIREAVAAYNEAGRYGLIFDSSASSPNGLPQVVHAPGATDITAEVIAWLERRAAEKAKEEAAKPTTPR